LPRTWRAVEGSRLELEFLPSKPLREMKLAAGNRTLELTRGEGEWYRYTTSLKESLTLSAPLTDRHGLTYLAPATSNMPVYADQPPTVALIAPQDSVSLPPDDKVSVEFKASDDFGIQKAELVVEISPPPAPPVPSAPPTPSAPAAPPATSPTSATPATPATLPFSAPVASSAPSPANANQPITKVIPIPLDPNDPQKSIRQAINLDLKPFGLKTGQEVKYSVRVTDTRMAEATSGQPAQPSMNAAAAQNPSQHPSDPSAQANAAPAATQPSAASAQANAAATQPLARAKGSSPATQPSAAAAQATAASSQPSAAASQPSTASAQASAAPSTQPSSLSQNSDNRIAQSAHPSKPSKNQDASPNRSELPPKPPENITQRWAPFPQSANSSKRSIKVDEWAGTAGNDVRAKLEIAIDRYLADLDAALAAAQKPTEALKLHVEQKLNWTAAEDAQLASARKGAADASGVIVDAVKKTAGTPYAFMGLQLGDIGVSHVDPARKHLAAATNLKTDSAAQSLQLDRASYHLAQARMRLANLTREYEAVKKDNTLADAMQHLQKLHQLYLKDMMAALASSRA
jgi:hypothetical protein